MPSDTIPQHFTTEFNTNWEARIQQTTGRLDAFIDFVSFNGERKRFDRMGVATSRERTERKGPTPVANRETDFRWAYRRLMEIPAVLLDKDDADNLGQLVLPTSQYVMDNAKQYHRDIDDLACSTALGAVMTGQLGDTSTAFPTSTQWIGKGGVVGASTGTAAGLTVAKLITANQIFLASEVDPDLPRVLVCSAPQITNLLNTTKVTSSDYASVKALAAGQIDTFMGFKFVVNNRLALASNIRSCAAWVKGAVKIVKGSMQTTIDRRPDLSNATQIYSTYNLGGTRVHDETVVQIDCDESAAQPT